LFELALDFIPGAFELESVHINYSTMGGAVGCIRSAANESFIASDRRTGGSAT
jgi:hypothetical protein